MLTARALRKRYGDVTALDGFDLTVEAGEIVGLVGHNGSGKTTFVEIVTGLTRPDAGCVTVAGIDVTTRPRQARALLGVAPQDLGLYLSLTVAENIALFGRLGGLRGRAMRSRVADTARQLDLTEVLDRPVGLLSGGQQRRAQAATALVHQPKLLILDEPTTGADPTTRQALLDVIRRLADDGTAVCYTTHYLPELADLEATIAVVAHGRIVARGSQTELLATLPGELSVTFRDGQRMTVRTNDPARSLRELLADDRALRDVDIRRPSLDDLYHAMETSHVGSRPHGTAR
jgi:ABC-2 type transport system ATP-binding protein